MRHVIARDAGGVGVKAGVAGAGGEPPRRTRRATGRAPGPGAVLASVLGVATERRAHGERHLGEPADAADAAAPGSAAAGRGLAAPGPRSSPPRRRMPPDASMPGSWPGTRWKPLTPRR